MTKLYHKGQQRLQEQDVVIAKTRENVDKRIISVISPDIHDLRGKLGILRQRIECLSQQVEANSSGRQMLIGGKPPPSKKNFRALEAQVCDNDRDVHLLQSSVTVLEGQVAELVAALESGDKNEISKKEESATSLQSDLTRKVTWLKRELVKERHRNDELERCLETVETLLPSTDQPQAKQERWQDLPIAHEGIIL